MDLSKIRNPYDFANPVGEKSVFIGRDAIMRDVRYYLNLAASSPRAINLAIIGDRASGKTSILNMIELEAAELSYCVVRIELDEGDAISPLMFFFKLFDAIITQACLEGFFGGTDGETYNNYRDMVDTFEIPEQKLFCPFLFPMQYARAMHAGRTDIGLSDLAVKTDLSTIQKELGRPIAIILDECDVLSQSRVHLQKLRNIFMNTPGFMLVATGTPNFFPIMDDVFSPIIRQFKKIEVGPFQNANETQELIRRPLDQIGISELSTVFDFDMPFQVAEIHNLTGGRPYEIQLLCHFLFRRVQDGQTKRMQLDVGVLDDVRKELATSQDVTQRPIINTIQSLSEAEINALNYLTQCDRNTTFEELWFCEAAFNGEERWTKESLRGYLHLFESKEILHIENDRIRFLGDDFEEIYCKYWARNKGFELNFLDISFEGYFHNRLDVFLSGDEEFSIIKLIRGPQHPDLDSPEFQSTYQDLENADSTGNSFETKQEIAAAAYWLSIDYRNQVEIEFIRISVDSPWVKSHRWYRSTDPNKGPGAIDFQSILSDASNRIVALGGVIKIETSSLSVIPSETLATKLANSNNSQIRERIGNLHGIEMSDAYLKRGDLEAGIFHGILANRYDPTSSRANNLGYLYLTTGNLDKATELFSNAKDESQESLVPIALYNLGVISAKKDDLLKAAEKFQETINSPGGTAACLIVPVMSESRDALEFQEQLDLDLHETATLALSVVKGVLDER